MKEMKVAEALLLRKNYEQKLSRLEIFKDAELYEVKTSRKQIKEGEIEEITTKAPRLSLKEVMEEYNNLSKRIRQLDASIQKANWDNSVELPDDFEE